jgi:rhodanese-related sulfurtransferase
MVLAVTLSLVGSSLLSSAATAAEVPRITKEELRARLGDPNLAILDVRRANDWSTSDAKILGAVRADPGDVAAWADTVPKEKTLVLYCAWPDEGTSARVAQELLDNGFAKVYALKGGWNEWVRANFPTEPK